MFEALNTPGRAYAEIEKAAVAEHSENEMRRLKLKIKAAAKSDELLEVYGEYLNKDLIASAKKLTWQAEGPFDYKNLFLSNVLDRAYRPFDESHKNYFRILRVIREFNPEWEKAFERRHNDWVKMLKDRKVPIYIGTQ